MLFYDKYLLDSYSICLISNFSHPDITVSVYNTQVYGLESLFTNTSIYLRKTSMKFEILIANVVYLAMVLGQFTSRTFKVVEFLLYK